MIPSNLGKAEAQKQYKDHRFPGAWGEGRGMNNWSTGDIDGGKNILREIRYYVFFKINRTSQQKEYIYASLQKKKKRKKENHKKECKL